MDTQKQTEKMMSDQIDQIATALCQAQHEMTYAKKDSENPFFKSKYADLASIVDVIKEPLKKNDLSYTQLLKPDPQHATVVTMLMHKSGQWIRSEVALRPTKNDPQGMGSSITYGRRYALAAILGIVQEDDDGNSASQPKKAESFKSITPDQAMELEDLIKETETDAKKFLKAYKCDSLEKFPAQSFDNAKKLLEKKKVSK